MLSSLYIRDLSLAPIRFVQFVPRFVPRCRLYSFIISMGNHDNERKTADVNTAGAKTENEPIPAWAKIYFDQQVRLLERMNSLVMDNFKPKQKKANVQCYKCGKYGNYARECRLSAPSQGNAKIPPPPQTAHTEIPEINKIGQCNGRQYNICKLSCKWILRNDFV